VAGERRARILSRLVDTVSGEFETTRLCEVCRDITDMTGAGIMLMSEDVPRGSLCTTGGVSEFIEQLQYSLGEGPCVDASNLGRPVLEPDLSAPAVARWIAFAGPAVDAGVRAIFGFPLVVGAVHLGALNLYRDTPGPLTDEQHADALVMADVAAQAVMALQAGAPAGQLAAELEAGADFHFVVQQAAGMVAAQLSITVAAALIRLRAYAFGNDRVLDDVARDVVSRALRFGSRAGGQDAGP
jgi:GAF domain-containing protein